ncbi:hypothetical protein GTW71_26100 [Streptomyces sp. SID6041]|nr:hypothetical protein [Streptomyces sp. SID6041]
MTATLARAVVDRAEGESPLAALRRGFAHAVEACDPVAGFAGPGFACMIADSPTLSARLRELHDLREEPLAEALSSASRSSTLAGEPNARITAVVAPEAPYVFAPPASGLPAAGV